jgi:hypothetical protein
MPAGQLYIYYGGQYKDAFTTWGVSLSDGALSNLMAFPPVKGRVSNESRLEHGKRVSNALPRKASRDITLEMHMIAPNFSAFLTKYNSFVNVLANGEIRLKTSFQPNVVYHLYYISCTQFSQLNGLAKFSLRLEEPNPNNRS